MTPEDLCTLVFEQLDELKAQNIIKLDVRDLTNITDYLFICSGTSTRQTKAIANRLVEKAKKQGVQPLSVNGDQSAEWILVDLADVVVHIMLPEARSFYQLEQLWQPTTVSQSS